MEALLHDFFIAFLGGCYDRIKEIIEAKKGRCSAILTELLN